MEERIISNESENENPKLEKLDDFLDTFAFCLCGLVFLIPQVLLITCALAYLRVLVS